MKTLGGDAVYIDQLGVYIELDSFFVDESGLYSPFKKIELITVGEDPEFIHLVKSVYSYHKKG